MKIEAKLLENYFKKIYCDGTISEAKIDFGKDKISMISRDPAGIVLLNVEMNAPKVYEPLGILAFKNVGIFIKYIQRFSGEIDVSIDGNLLVLKQADRMVEYILADEKAIDVDDVAYPDVSKWGVTFDTISSSILKEISNDFEVLGANKMVFEVKNGKLTITAGDNESDRITESCSINIKDMKTGLGEASIKIIKQLPTSVKIGLGNKVPVLLDGISDDGITFRAVIAPRLDDE